MLGLYVTLRVRRLLGLPQKPVGPIGLRLRYESILVDVFNNAPWVREADWYRFLLQSGWRGDPTPTANEIRLLHSRG